MMASIKRYAVVTFPADDNISEIPSIWLFEDNKKCWWPEKNVNQKIKKYAKPEATWQQFDVKVECYCSTLEKARKKADNINYVTTDSEKLGRGERRRKYMYDSDSSDSSFTEDTLTPPPGISSNIDASMGTTEDLLMVKSPVTSVQSMSDLVIDKSLVTSVQSISESLETNSTTENNTRPEDAKLESTEDALKKIMKQLNSILFYVKNIDENLKQLERPRPVESQHDEGVIYLKEMLPIKNEIKMRELESAFKDNENYLKLFKKIISNTGGKNPKENLQRICKIVFSNEFAINCSWLGHRNNFRICDLTCMKIIKEFILEQYAEKINLKEIETICSEWFRLAKLRFDREKKQSVNI